MGEIDFVESSICGVGARNDRIKSAMRGVPTVVIQWAWEIAGLAPAMRGTRSSDSLGVDPRSLTRNNILYGIFIKSLA